MSDETVRAAEPDVVDTTSGDAPGGDGAAADDTSPDVGPADDTSADDGPVDDDSDDPMFEPSADPVATARRRHGTAGAILAAGLFGVDVALGRKPREDIPVVVASNSEPVDIDTDGISLAVDDQTTVIAPALPRSEPQGRPRRSRRTRRNG